MKKFTIVLITLLLSGCSSYSNSYHKQSFSSGALSEPSSKKMLILEEGTGNLKVGDYAAASLKFNEILRGNISNATFQTLNGIAYHLDALENDADKLNLAEQGYELATKFDPSDWTPFYLNGLAKLSQKRYRAAKLNFAKAVTRDWKNDRAMFNLMAAAYYDVDFELALKALGVLQTRSLEMDLKLEVDRACAIIQMAVRNEVASSTCLQDYLSLEMSDARKETLKKRLGVLQAINFVKQSKPSLDAFQNVNETSEPDILAEERMVVVDVVIIGSTEDVRNVSGLNILNGLAIQFGNTADGIPAFSQSRSIANDNYSTDDDAQTRTIVRALTVPAIQYSLNIMNSADSNNTILAKPSLIALSGETSSFFSGVSINGAATSGTGDSISIEREIGVTLSVTPQFLADNRVMLTVDAERTFLMDPASNVIYEFRMDTSKTTVNANVVMNIGETLVLGGLTEQQDSDSLDGVPGLRRLPVIKNLFSSEEERRYKKTVTVLLTPRLASSSEETKPTEAAFQDEPNSPDKLMLRAMFDRDLNMQSSTQMAGQLPTPQFASRYFSDADVVVRSPKHEIIGLAEKLIERMTQL